MTVRRRWVRRSLALWGGLLAAWGAAAVVAYLRFREHLTLLLVATAALALVFGAARTARLRAQDDQPLITVEDLHRR